MERTSGLLWATGSLQLGSVTALCVLRKAYQHPNRRAHWQILERCKVLLPATDKKKSRHRDR